MPELTPQERLQPSLLDRLRDEEPDAQQESRERRIMSMRQLRESVLRDLAWLLNTSCHFTPEEAQLYPEAARSVINYGIPDLCGLTGVDPIELQRTIKEAIVRFEPRVLPPTLKVSAPAAGSISSLFFEIQGELWAKPIPEQLYLRTQVDLETGQCDVQEGRHG